MEEVRRVVAAVGLPDFQYFAIPAAVPETALEIDESSSSASVLIVPADMKMSAAVAAAAQPEPQRVTLSIVRSVTPLVVPAVVEKRARSFLLLADVATAVASGDSFQVQGALDTAGYETSDTMPKSRRTQFGGRAATAGRR